MLKQLLLFCVQAYAHLQMDIGVDACHLFSVILRKNEPQLCPPFSLVHEQISEGIFAVINVVMVS